MSTDRPLSRSLTTNYTRLMPRDLDRNQEAKLKGFARVAKQFIDASNHMVNAANDIRQYEPGTPSHKKALVRYLVVEQAYDKREAQLRTLIEEFE